MTSQRKPWIRARKDAEAAIIFIHGVNSAASSCWQSKTSYWPELIRRDKRFSAFDIFAPDYFTGLDASDYGIADCASALVRQFQTSSTPHGRALFSYGKIIIVAHSFGGVIARYIIESQREKFSKKTIGLVLMASPSRGSIWAEIIRFFTWPINHRQRDELSPFNSLLDDLDNRFKRLVHAENLDFKIIGVEAYEQNRLFGIKRIVSKKSATPYFGESVHIQGSSHSSIVKPETIDHPSYQLLASFCEEHFRSHFAIARMPAIKNSEAKTLSLALFDVYHPDCDPYYLSRPIDKISSQTARFRSIWFYGESGVGKTSVARKLFGKSLEETINIYLANCELPLSENLINEIGHAIRDRCESQNANSTESGNLALELSNFGNQFGQLNILIDEVSIGTNESENQSILQRISHLLHEIKVINSKINVLIVLISLNKPAVKDDAYPGKFTEFFQIIKIPKWQPNELRSLANVIGNSDIDANISDIANKAISEFPSTPRELKTKIRDALIQLNH